MASSMLSTAYPVTPSSITSATAPFRESQDGGAAGHRLDHGESERLGPVDREEEGARLAEELDLAAIVDLADELDARFLQQGLDLRAEVGLVYAIDLGGNLQRQAGGARDRNRAVDALLRRYAAEERQIAATRDRASG